MCAHVYKLKAKSACVNVYGLCKCLYVQHCINTHTHLYMHTYVQIPNRKTQIKTSSCRGHQCAAMESNVKHSNATQTTFNRIQNATHIIATQANTL